jgi:hypothetical protein
MTKFMVEFAAYGSGFDPDDITSILNITPTRTYKDKELITDFSEDGIVTKEKETCWEVSSEYYETADLDVPLQKNFNQIKDKEPLLKKLKKMHDIDYKFTIVLHIGSDRPMIGFDKDIVRFAAEIGACFDFDTYI